MDPPSRLWAVGTWREARQIGGRGCCYSADGRLVVVQDADKVVRLVETETGRTLAKVESPDQCAVGFATFSPDGSLLALTTNDGPAVHVWDLRALRHNLAEMGLDWDAPPYPESDSAAENVPVLPLRVKVDLGPIKPIRPEVRLLLGQAQQLEHDGKIAQAIAALRQGTRSFPNECEIHNSLAWRLAASPEPLRNAAEAVEHARRAVELHPGYQLALNTLGVALYRAGKFAEAVETLEKSQRAGDGEFAAFDLFFLAMAHQKLGHGQQARACLQQADASFEANRASLPPEYIQELTKFRTEAERVLAGDGAELPDQVFAGER
jgi:tetratricopeptide (TPR) repeat protein